MSRHRNVRSMNYEDEYYDDDDVYGHSVEENYCISPGTAAQFTYNRDSHVELSNYMGEVERIPEEDEDDENDGLSLGDSHRNSFEYKRPPLSDLDNAKLNSCLEEVRNVLGDTVPEHILIDTIMKHGYSVDLTLNELLNQQDAPKPQREKRENRRNRSQEYDNDLDPGPDTGFNPNKTPQTACTDISHDNIFSYILPHLGGNMKFGPDSSNKLPEVDNESDKVELITDTLESAVILSDDTKTEKKKPHLVSKTENAQGLLSQPNTHDEQTTARNHKNDHSSKSYSDISRSLSGLILSHKVATSSKTRTKSNQNILDTHNANKVTASSGMSLVELSKIHGSNNQPFHSLSELRNIDKESKGINTDTKSSIKSSEGLAASKQHLCGSSIPDLAKTHGRSSIKQAEIETLQAQTPFSLQDLAREHEKKVSKTNKPQGKLSGHGDPENTMAARTREIDKQGPSLAGLSNTTLADLAKENTHQNQNTASITSLSQLSNSSHSLKSNFGKGPNNETRHEETGKTSTDLAVKGAVHKRKETTLSDLMNPCNKPAKEGLKTSVFSGQTSLSLADLAKAHGVVKKEPDTLLTLGHTNSVEKTGKATGYHVGTNAKSQTKPELAPGLKVKDTKKVMDSLSSRIDSFAGIEVRQQAAYGPIRSKIIHPENPSLGSLPEYSVPLISGTKSNNSSCGSIGPQQNYLASKDDCKDTRDKSVNKKSNLTLADLVKPVEEVKEKVMNIQESDIKEHTKEQGNEKSSGPSKDALVTQNFNCMERDDKSNARTDLDVGCTVFEEISLLNSNEFFMQSFDQILACPSVLGKMICLSMRFKEKSFPFYRNKYFKYGNQMKSVRRVEKSISGDVKPFDFSTPSPDDIVQSRQKLAFTRSGNRQ